MRQKQRTKLTMFVVFGLITSYLIDSARAQSLGDDAFKELSAEERLTVTTTEPLPTPVQHFQTVHLSRIGIARRPDTRFSMLYPAQPSPQSKTTGKRIAGLLLAVGGAALLTGGIHQLNKEHSDYLTALDKAPLNALPKPPTYRVPYVMMLSGVGLAAGGIGLVIWGR